MKTKRFAAVLAVVLALVCCAPARGDLLIPGERRRRGPSFSRRMAEFEAKLVQSLVSVGKLKPLSDDAQLSEGRARRETEVSATLMHYPKLSLELTLSGPGAYKCVLRDDEGRTVGSREGVNEWSGPRPIWWEAILKTLKEGETARYALEASFVPYQYEDTSFGPKLIEGPEGGPRLGLRQELKRELVIENVRGDIRIRVE